MRIKTLAVVGLMGFGLSGCSLWTKSDKADDASSSDGSYADAGLRTSPQQTYDFDGQSFDVDIYDTASQYSASQYAGYAVELYDTRPTYAAASYSDPRQSEFVMLNGQSETADWQNCETRHRGYLFISEYDFTLDPGFEVCMRNKGYVLSTEYGPSSKRGLTAQTAGLRGRYAQSSMGSAFFR